VKGQENEKVAATLKGGPERKPSSARWWGVYRIEGGIHFPHINTVGHSEKAPGRENFCDKKSWEGEDVGNSGKCAIEAAHFCEKKKKNNKGKKEIRSDMGEYGQKGQQEKAAKKPRSRGQT